MKEKLFKKELQSLNSSSSTDMMLSLRRFPWVGIVVHLGENKWYSRYKILVGRPNKMGHW
jgi:hypothetical protein